MDSINRGSGIGLGWLRYVGWAGAAALLLLPAAAMRLAPDSGVNWGIEDFLFAAVLIGSLGLGLELAVRASRNWWYRAGAAVGLGTGFLLTLANAAVGYIGDDNLYNLIFFAIVAAALIGSALVRLRARGMATVMLGAGIAHAVAGAIGYPHDPVTGPITAAFTAMWLTSAWLFSRAARDGAAG